MAETLKERWYCLPKWQRHVGGSAVLMIVFSAIPQLWGAIDWSIGATAAMLFGAIKEGLEKNTIETAMTDIAMNMGGVGFVFWVLSLLGAFTWQM